MDEDEIARRHRALPPVRRPVPSRTLELIELMNSGGEYGELTIELAASLAAHQAPVTAAERDELRELLEAMGMPTDPIGALNVRD